MIELLASPLFAGLVITVFSVHVIAATLATYCLTVKRAPIDIIGPTFMAWFIPVFGPLATMLHTGRIRDWTDEEIREWLRERDETERAHMQQAA